MLKFIHRYELYGVKYMAYIEFDNVTKEYITGEVKVKALNNANFSVDKGELVVILGPSGAGKTTALNILGGPRYQQKEKRNFVPTFRLLYSFLF